MKVDITYTNTLTPAEFNALRVAVGWNAIESSLAINGLEHTAFVVCARDEGKAIGMARFITDYGYTIYIADVIVHPDYQGKGLGREIMTRIMAYINANIAPGQWKFITLMAAKGKEGFYEKFGFNKRPADDAGCGMSQRIDFSEATP